MLHLFCLKQIMNLTATTLIYANGARNKITMAAGIYI